MTRLIRGLNNLTQAAKGGVITIGNFDGVHLGHQALIHRVTDQAKRLNAPSILITFEPQPLEFFNEKPVARLTRWREKYCALAKTDLDYILTIRFNQPFAQLTAEEFVEKILVNALAIKHITVGDDFQFGWKRQGDFTYLQKKAQQYGFKVDTLPTLTVDGTRVSSTEIRNALALGNHDRAEHLLGHPYTMMGRVVHGDKLGRKLGFPTANIYLHRSVTPIQGIYIVRMHGINAQPLPGVANVGIRPTVGGTRTLLEVFLFNFNEDIYGKHVTVEFCKKIRDEEHYANLELLKDAIRHDAAQAKTYFMERGELKHE